MSSFYKRANGKTLQNHIGELVELVGTVDKFEDPTTLVIQSNTTLTAHIPASFDAFEIGEAYVLFASVQDDHTVNVKHFVSVPKSEYHPEVIDQVVAKFDQHRSFFY